MYRILGPLELETAGRVVVPGGTRQQTLLAVLLLDAGATVSFDRLVDELWDRPPPTARRQVVNAAAALRRTVEGCGGGPLLAFGHGYRLETAGAEIDVRVVDALTAEAEAAVAGYRTAAAVELLSTALDRWRGPVLAGLSSASIDVTRQRLTEQRLAVIERLAGLSLELGEVTSLIGRLIELVAQHPTRESLRATLMRVLHHAGRSAEALAVFVEGRRLVVDEYGVDPGPELRALYEEILRASDDRGRVDVGRPRAVSPAQGPCFLPSGVADFTGRQEGLKRLTGLASSAVAGSATVIAVEGMGGVGKTALAVHAAHRLLDGYPDGQYFVDLRGFAEDGPPMSPEEAVEVLLRQSGVPPERIPVDAVARRDLWRARTAGRRVLVVLDNAADAAQLRPLLPASHGSLVLVTTRRQLPALEGAVPLPLAVLSQVEAAALFRRIAGPDRVDAEPDACREVVELCCGLPLAIRIAAARFCRRPAWTLAQLVGQLRAQHGLVAGDRSVAGAIALSYRHLDPANRRVFRLLGLLPGTDLDVHAAAALAGASVAEVTGSLEELLECSLLLQDLPGRYRMHDLVRDSARALAAATDPAGELHTAQHRLLDYYLGFVDAQCRALPIAGHPFRLELKHPPESLPTSSSEQESIARLEAEYANLVAAANHASTHGWRRHAWQLPCLMRPFLGMVGRLSGMLDMAHDALVATQRLGDRHGESVALANLAMVLREQGRLDEVLAVLERAIGIGHELGDLAAVMARTRDVGNALFQAGRLTDAATTFTEARGLARRLGDRSAEIGLTFNLAVVDCNLGRYDEALGHLNHALAHYRRAGDAVGLVTALINIGWVGQVRGRDDEAIAALKEALRLSRAAGYVRGEARTLAWLAVSHRRLGMVSEAVEVGRAAVDTARRSTLLEEECDALNGLAEAHLAARDWTAAESAAREAELLAMEGVLPMSTARALECRAHAAAAHGDVERATGLWKAALASYPPGTDYVAHIRAHLSAPAGEPVRCMRCQVGGSVTDA